MFFKSEEDIFVSAVYLGTCHCNQIELQLRLPKALNEYSPRACDCDYCMQQDAMYVSDPLGTLDIVSTISLARVKQGSMQAEFLNCVNCEQLVAVVSNIDGLTKGAVNAECLHDSQLLKAPTAVNPQTLNAEQKRERWSQHWSSVSLSEPD
jgi:hypothetical protein